MLKTVDSNMNVNSSDSVDSATQPSTAFPAILPSDIPSNENEMEQYPISKVTTKQSAVTTNATSTTTSGTPNTSGSSSSSNSNPIEHRLDACFQQEIEARQQCTKKEKRSGDLPVLEREYEKMKLRFVRIVSAAKNYHQQSVLLNQYRLEVRVYVGN